MRLFLMTAALAAFVSPTYAADGYDHRLEQQVKQIVAAKIGKIRGGLSYDKVLVFPMTEDQPQSRSFQTLRAVPVTGKPHFQVIE